MEKILDASPNKKGFKIPTEPKARRTYYLGLMERYQASNPVKFESKREELQKKVDGYDYVFNPKTNRAEWMLVYPVKGNPEIEIQEPKKTPIEKELAAEAEEELKPKVSKAKKVK